MLLVLKKPHKKKNEETQSTQQGHNDQLKIEMKAYKSEEKE